MTVSVSAKYPALPFVDDVQVVFDVGAHDAAASVHFAGLYRDAVVHRFEPDPEARARAKRDLAAYATAHVHDVDPRRAGSWCRAQGITRIDVISLDAEGATDVLESIEQLLPTVKVLYVEYDSRTARRRIRDLMSPDHELYTGALYLDQGEIIYLRNDYATHEAATPTLRDLLAARLGFAAGAATATAPRDAS